MPISDRDHPFYRPLWRRVAIVAVTAGWAAAELYFAREVTLWAGMALALLAYAVWTFLITWKPPADET